MTDDPRAHTHDANGTCRALSRRRFLAGMGSFMAAMACAGTSIAVFKAGRADAAYSLPGATAAPRPGLAPGSFGLNGRSLIVIELGGGNDALSTVVPLSGRYRDLRPTTAVTDPRPLDAEAGLHPRLKNVARMYEAGEVAIVEGLGMSKADLSHFVQMRRWWDGAPDSDHTGWLGRYLDATVGYEQVLAGISIGPGPSPAMLGRNSYVVGISDASGLGSGIPWWVDDARDFMGIWSGFAPADVPVSELDPVRQAIAASAGAQRQLSAGLSPLARTLEGLEVEAYSLEGQLALAAALVASDVHPQVVYVHGNVDFDTHEDQLGRHAELMGQLDRGIGHARDILTAAGEADHTIIMTTSEFGRRAGDNDGGTDHGTAGTHFVIGPPVAGGRYGEAPSLRRLDRDGNLIHNVDFRSLYASVLEGWLGAGSDELLRGRYETLDLFKLHSADLAR